MQGLNTLAVAALVMTLQNPLVLVLARLAGRDVPRTDQHGAITVETDGTQMWVQVAR